ncbi:MAG TPA: hypothetical protein VH107_04350 [Lacipirellulaceae bacterium]|nr:hypothetical protein [Lacipirellulaceae bacterium]
MSDFSGALLSLLLELLSEEDELALAQPQLLPESPQLLQLELPQLELPQLLSQPQQR